jgi:hypothetical protein
MYNYKEQRGYVFTEEGQVQFLRIRDRVKGAIKNFGAIRMDSAIRDETGSIWEIMACVDRLVELGEITEVTDNSYPGQHRIFTSFGR